MTVYGKQDDSVDELWAILDETGAVMWSRGGSSTKRHLMVFPSEAALRKALNNSWTRQIIPDPDAVRIECIYNKAAVTP